MSVGLQVWSQTASNNSTADTNINWPEGMAPSQVDDSARAVMASMAKWRDDNNGTIVTGGTTVAFTATTSQVEASLTAGYTISIQFNATADTSATLAVDGLAAKPLQIVTGTNLQGGEFTAGDICDFTYSSTGTGQWIARGPQAYLQNSNQLADTVVTYQKLQTPGASKLLANPSTSTSTGWREITLGTNLSFSGTVLNAGNTVPVPTIITSTATVTYNSTTNAAGNFPLYLRVRMCGPGGGGGAATTNNGSTGTNTIFGGWTALPGLGGNTATGAGGLGGTGGANGTGTLITRLNGGTGLVTAGNNLPGAGGANPFGGAGAQSPSGTTPAAAVPNSGAGGAGGFSGGSVGPGGGAGEYVEFLITASTSSSLVVQVGAGGAGGGAGGVAGGAGAAGRIEVIQYWQ